MCGIAGLVLDDPGEVDGKLAADLLAGLAHRGPDDEGWLSLETDGPRRGRGRPRATRSRLLLLSRRLSILDPSEAGWQPMAGVDGSSFIVFNGEISNYLELRAELQALGRCFRSGTDTEVLLAGLDEWGTGILERLVGMFAFAHLDVRSRRLLLARDAFGIKPLYLTRWRRGIAFGSEPGPLLELPGVGRRVDAQRLVDYLRFGSADAGDGTFFSEIRQLPAAHLLEIDLDRPRLAEPTRYWGIDPDADCEAGFEEAADHVRDLFLESVELHLRSDVPVAAQLSGGIDSSAIVGAARTLLGDDAKLSAYSYVSDVPSLNEERWIDLMAERARVEVAKVRPVSADLPADLDRLIELQQEPFDGLLVYAQYRVFSRMAEDGVKVVLNGQGADEQLGGYRIFLTARLASLVRQRRWAEAAAFAKHASRQPVSRGLPRLLRAEGLLLPAGLRGPARRLADDPLVPAWLDQGWLRDRGVSPEVPPAPQGKEALREALTLLLTETKLPHLLRREDRNSMALSIECRVPFLTPRLAGYLSSLPEEYLIAPDGTTKAVFRRAMRGIVPDEILERRDKLGFQTPEQDWLLAERAWVDGVFAAADPARIPALRLDRIKDEWARARPRGAEPESAARGTRFWRLVNVIRWAERFDVTF